MRVRAAGVDDTEAVFRLGCRMHEESATDFPGVERAKVEHSLALCTQYPEVFWAAVAETGGEVVGVSNAIIGDYAFSSQKRGLVDIIYVLPEHRGSSAAVRLLRAYRQWAEANGAARHYAGITTGIHPERTAKFMTGLGYRKVGEMFIAEAG